MSQDYESYNRYVCGFAFNVDRTKVILIEKDRPKWQAGKLNGVGGKIEWGESIYQAMNREFVEETGITVCKCWSHIVSIYGRTWEGHFMMAEMEDEYFYTARKMETERPRVIEVKNIWSAPVIENLRWMLPLCIERDRYNNFPIILRE